MKCTVWIAIAGSFAAKVALAQVGAPCRVAGIDQQVRCATVEVPENRANPGRTIRLRVVILPSRSAARALRPALFYLVGGPGLAASTLADLVASSHSTTRDTHDIVLVDQRGTGGSNALDCDLYGDVQKYLGDQFVRDAVRECAERLASRGEFREYTTENAAEDLEAVRERIGVDRIDIDASAYGTRVALAYMRRYPDHVRSVVLQGVIGENISLTVTAARDAQRALDRVFADCAADPFCRTSFPAPQRELSALLSRLDHVPSSLRVQQPRSTDSITVMLSRGVFADRLRLMLYSTRLSRRIPMLVHRAHQGDWTPFVTLAYEISRVVFDQLDVGAHLSAACPDRLSEEVEARGTFLGDYRRGMYRDACSVWPHSAASSSRAPIRTAAPVLLVTGALDPVTPPQFAEAVAREVPNATVMIVPGMAHAGTERCVEEVVASFVVRGTMQGVDSSCISGLKAPPFVTW